MDAVTDFYKYLHLQWWELGDVNVMSLIACLKVEADSFSHPQTHGSFFPTYPTNYGGSFSEEGLGGNKGVLFLEFHLLHVCLIECIYHL